MCVWMDKDFKYFNLEKYYQGNISEELTIEPKRVFHAYLEDWEDHQIGSKGDDVHATKVSAKHEGLGFMMKIMIVLGSFVRLIVLC